MPNLVQPVSNYSTSTSGNIGNSYLTVGTPTVANTGCVTSNTMGNSNYIVGNVDYNSFLIVGNVSNSYHIVGNVGYNSHLIVGNVNNIDEIHEPQDDIKTRLAWNILYNHCFKMRPQALPIENDNKNESKLKGILLVPDEKFIAGITAADKKQIFYFEDAKKSKTRSYLQKTKRAWNILFKHCFMPKSYEQLTPHSFMSESREHLTPHSFMPESREQLTPHVDENANIINATPFSDEKSIIGLTATNNKQTFFFDNLVQEKILSYLKPKHLQVQKAKA